MAVEKLHSITIYLLKKRVNTFDDALENPMHKIEIGEDTQLFYPKSYESLPKWASFFEGSALDGLYTANASALLLVKEGGRMFAIPFGPAGRHYLKKGLVEERFGLRTTLNSIKEGSLRSIDAISLGNEGMQVRTQSSRPTPSDVFGLDVERDLVSSVTGELIPLEGFGKTISGRDSLHITVKGGLSGIKSKLITLLELSGKETYKDEFKWIDNLSEVTDIERISRYNEALVERINDNTRPGKAWLSVPEIINWDDHAGFKYSNKKRSPVLDDVYLDDFLANIDKDAVVLEDLKSSKIYRFQQANEYARDHWRVYDCIYYELTSENETIFLSGGRWYEVKNDIVSEVNRYIATIPRDPVDISFPEYRHKSENVYNEDLAKVNNAQCVDAKKIMIESRSSFEFCDVYTKNKQLIHVKIYSRSSVLSHLFSQGYVSANMMMDPEFRSKINKKLRADLKIQNTLQRPGIKEYTVVYGIITAASSSFDLPFFSKLTLMHAAKDLEKLGFAVFVVKIPRQKGSTIKPGA